MRPNILLSAAAAALLLAEPLRGQAATMASAEELMRTQRWAEAAAAYALIVEANPADGAAHYLLGLAHSRLGDCASAVPSLRRSVELGGNGGTGGPRQARVIVAGCLAMQGDTAAALEQLEIAWRTLGLRDFSQITPHPRFSSIVGTERYRSIAGITPPGLDRTSRWRHDLAWLDRLVRQTHPEPFHTVSEAAWTAEVARISAAIPSLSDNQVIAAMMRLVAMVGDGHTALYPPFQGPGAWRLLPIWPVRLADGWYVGAAASSHRSLVGARIVGAGERDILVLDSIARSMLARDNEWTALWLAQIPLQVAEFYQVAGATGADGSVNLRVVHADGRTDQVTLQPEPLDRDPNARWAPRAWPTMAGARAPRWIRYADAWAAIEWLPRERVLYVALNAVIDTADRSLGDLGRAVRDSIAARRAAGVVLDLRLNNGGNYTLLPQFLQPIMGLPVFQETGAFQVLTGPRTFSATAFLVHELMRFTEAERVGWPTGARPVVYGTEVPFRLPASGLMGSVSMRLEVAAINVTDMRPTFAPFHAVWPTGADLSRGADPVLDAALARIAARNR